MVLATHRVAPSESTQCSNLYLRGLSSITRTTPVTANETWARTRFRAVAQAISARKEDLTKLSTDLTSGILAERGRELSWENCRRRDLIRFDQFENVQYVTNKALTRRWFPIPFAILQKSVVVDGKPLWTQNEGY